MVDEIQGTCVPCSGTGLRDSVTLCPTCNGSGGRPQPADRDPEPDVTPVESVTPAPAPEEII